MSDSDKAEAVRLFRSLRKQRKRAEGEEKSGIIYTYDQVQDEVNGLKVSLHITLHERNLLLLEEYWDNLKHSRSRLEAMAYFDTLGYWFLLLKWAFPIYFYRLLELDLFARSLSLLVVDSAGQDWLDVCLNRVYTELLSKRLDPTLFYRKSSLRRLFGEYSSLSPLLRTADHIKQMAMATNQTEHSLYQDPLDEADEKVLSKMDIDRHYSENKSVNFCAIDTGKYRIVKLRLRLALQKTMVVVFDALREYYRSSRVPVPEEDQGMLATALFDLFREYVDSLKTMEEEFKELHLHADQAYGRILSISDRLEQVTPVPRAILAHRIEGVITQVRQLYPNHLDKEEFSVLFRDDVLYDSDIRVNREKYLWVQPFNESDFINRRTEGEKEITPMAQETRNQLLREEAILWINLLRHKQGEPGEEEVTEKSKRRRSEKEKSKGRKEEKRKKLSAKLYTEGLASILHITAGSGQLVITTALGKSYYDLKPDSRIELPPDTIYELIDSLTREVVRPDE